jgi:N-acetyl-gamma-glutamyl-phosphate reductase
MISVGIIGGTGYTGKKLLQLLNSHPFLSEIHVYAKSTAGTTIYELFPELDGCVPNSTINHFNDISYDHDIYFLTLPVGEALNYVPTLIGYGKYVVDLSGDYRLDYEEMYIQWYNFTHTSSYLLKDKIYGIADHPKTDYSKSKLIANPGCYPTAILLSLLPLLPDMADEILTVSCTAYSGTTGAGKSPRNDLLLSEMFDNVKAYGLNKHKHEPEILQQLYKNGFRSPLSFSPHLLPTARGIYSTVTIHLKQEIDSASVEKFYDSTYENSPFIRLRKVPPELHWITDSNFCDINITINKKILIITAAIDNLVKGASGQAVQNMNKLFGWDETVGLIRKDVRHVSVHS